MKEFKIITITYIDSLLINEQTDEIAEPEIIDAVGYLIEKEKTHITIAREIVGREFRGQLSIPKEAVISMEVLNEGI